MEFEGRLHIARCDIGKVGHVARLGWLCTVHERERREIEDPCRLFDCGRRFDRVIGGRVFRLALFRSTSEEATKSAGHNDLSHHGARAEINYWIGERGSPRRRALAIANFGKNESVSEFIRHDNIATIGSLPARFYFVILTSAFWLS